MGAGVSADGAVVARDSNWGSLIEELETICKTHGGASDAEDPLKVKTFRGSTCDSTSEKRRSSVMRKESSLGKRNSSSVDPQGNVRRSSSVVGFKPGHDESPASQALEAATAAVADQQVRSPQAASFVTGPAMPPTTELERRLSNPQQRVQAKPGRAQLTKVKKLRKEFFEGWEAEGDTGPTMECSYIGLACAAISYLLQMRNETEGMGGGKSMKPVSVEDVFFTSRLPLYYMGKSAVTLSELYDICKEFVDHDPRCHGVVDVHVHHMETMLAEGEVEQGERANEVGDRGPMPLSEFRTVITDDTKGLKTITIFNYDPYVVEQEKMRVDDTDSDTGDEDEIGATVTSMDGITSPTPSANPSQVLHSLTRYKHKPESNIGPDNSGTFSLLSEFNAATGTCTLLDAKIGNDVHLQENSCPLSALYKACLTRDRRIKRCRGFLQFVMLGEEEEDDDDDRPHPDRMFPSDLILGHGPNGIPLISVSPRVSRHIVCFAYALHLVRGLVGDDSGNGVNLRSICTAMDFALPAIVHNDLPLLEAYAYFSAFLKQRMPEVWTTVQPVRKKVETEDSPPTLSMMDFHDVLSQATERSDSVEKVMVLKFDLRCAHSLLNIASPGTAHYGIVQEYDTERQLVRVLDVEPARFTKSWTTTLQRLHRAIIGHGYIMVYKSHCDSSENNVRNSLVMIKRQDTMVKNMLSHMTYRPPLQEKYVHFFEYPTSPMAVTALAAALNVLSPSKMVQTKDIVYKIQCDPSFLVERRMALNDLHRVTIEYLINSGRDKELTVEAVNFDKLLPKDEGGKSTERVSSDEFFMTLQKYVAENPPDQRAERTEVLLLQCAKRVLREHSGGEGGEYLILHDIVRDECNRNVAVVSDCSPCVHDRYLHVPVERLYEGMQMTDKLAQRARGYIRITRGTPLPRYYVHGKRIELSLVPQNRHFSLPQCPHLNGIAVALSTLGHPCCEEDIFYGAYSCLAGEKFRRGSAIFPWQQLKLSMSSLAERMTVTAVAKMVMKFESACRRDLVASTIVGSSKEDFIALLDDATSPIAHFLLVCIYTSDVVHGIEDTGNEGKWNIGCGIIKDYDAETNLVHVVDANSTRYGCVWSCDVDTFYEALLLNDADRGENGFVKIGKGTKQVPLTKRKSVVEREFFADDSMEDTRESPPPPQFLTPAGGKGIFD